MQAAAEVLRYFWTAGPVQGGQISSCRQMTIKRDAFGTSFSGGAVFTMVWAPVLGGWGALCPLTLSVDARAEASLALAGGVDTNFEVVESTIFCCFIAPIQNLRKTQ